MTNDSQPPAGPSRKPLASRPSHADSRPQSENVIGQSNEPIDLVGSGLPSLGIPLDSFGLNAAHTSNPLQLGFHSDQASSLDRQPLLQPPPSLTLEFPFSSQFSNYQQAAGTSPIPSLPFPISTYWATSGSQSQSQQADPSPVQSTLTPPEQETERPAIVEEKRRRNTAASARFRTKKKQRIVNLERSVSDLAGRAEDLKREVADLRQENNFLKEIVMLKGSRLLAFGLSSSEQHAGPSSSSHSELPLSVHRRPVGDSRRASSADLEEVNKEQEEQLKSKKD